MKVETRSDVAVALEVRGLSVELGKRPIVSDVRLDVPTGGWLCMIGPNGAGKTTLVHAIAGLVPRTGSVRLWGRSTDELGRRERARSVALVPQLPAIPESFTVEQYVLLGRTPHLGLLASEGASDLEAAATALERLDLGWAASRRLDSLSGGELRRAVIARAIAQEAPLLLLDEPTTGLDIAQQLRVLELVEELRRADGLTVVSTMHDLTLAGRFAQRFALLSSGRVVAEGTRGEVLLPHVIAEHYGARVGVIEDGTLGWAVVPLSGPEPVSEDRTPRVEPPTERPRRATEHATSRVLVHTGEGKGKSSAAMGVMLRAVSAGWDVAVVQFVKSGKWRSGEEAVGRSLGVDWWSLGDGFTWDSKDMDRSEAVGREAWRSASELIRAGEHRLVILDEITYPMNWGWIRTAEVVEAIRSRPVDVSIVATGRDAPVELREVADTVTEMVSEKHAIDEGIAAMRGIEF